MTTLGGGLLLDMVSPDKIQNPEAISSARVQNQQVIDAYLSAFKILGLRYHDRSLVQPLVDDLAARRTAFTEPMTEDEYSAAWTGAYDDANDIAVWLGSTCMSIEKTAGTPPPARY